MIGNDDRISDVYEGDLTHPTTIRARARIHWLCEQANGRTLDLGCSQGLAAALLVRDGIEVVGIDIESTALERAKEDLRATGGRVRLVAGSGGRLPFRQQSFDTVLLGEVLEHLANPQLVLQEVVRVLRPGGIVAITVPFGFSGHADHKRTFYPRSLLDLVGEHLTPTALEVVGQHIRAIAARRDVVPTEPVDRFSLEAQQIVERRFEEAQTELVRTLAQLKNERSLSARRDEELRQAAARADLAEDRLREHVAALEANRTLAEDVRAEANRAALRAARSDAWLEQREAEVTRLREELDDANRERGEATRRLFEVELAKADLENRLAAAVTAASDLRIVRSERDAARTEAARAAGQAEAAEAQVGLLQQRLSDLRRDREAALDELTIAADSAEAAVRRADLLQHELAQLRRDREAAYATAVTAMQQAEAAEARAAGLERALADLRAEACVTDEVLRASLATNASSEAAILEARAEIEQQQLQIRRIAQQQQRDQTEKAALRTRLEAAEEALISSRLRAEEERNRALRYRRRVAVVEEQRNALRHHVASLQASDAIALSRAAKRAAQRPWRVLLLPFIAARFALRRLEAWHRPPTLVPPGPTGESCIGTDEAAHGLQDGGSPEAGQDRPTDACSEAVAARDASSGAGTEANGSAPATSETNANAATAGVISVRDAPRERPRMAPSDLVVASILDEMSATCFAPECTLVSFRPDNYEEVLLAARPHLLLVESAWSGNDGAWQYRVGSYTHPDYMGLPDLRALITWCRNRGIPTVFWNKEDPVHFERFKEAAALFDVILTSDANAIPRYQELSHRAAHHIAALPFAAQPLLHNPVGAPDRRRDEPVFAGTYYRGRHPARRHQLEMILDAARPFGLVIYDRTHGTTSDEFGFPERFHPHVSGGLPYGEVLHVYRRHKLFVNVNSVVDSPTMFSRRVFELLASGAAVVSTPSLGISQMFPNLVPIVDDEPSATEALRAFIEDDRYRTTTTATAARLVAGAHTYRHRLADIAAAAGIDVDVDRDVGISILSVGETSPLAGLAKQTIRPREILVGRRNGRRDDDGWLSDGVGGVPVREVEIAGQDRVDDLRRLARSASSTWVASSQAAARTDAPTALEDLLLGAQWSRAEVVGFHADAGGWFDGRPLLLRRESSEVLAEALASGPIDLTEQQGGLNAFSMHPLDASAECLQPG